VSISLSCLLLLLWTQRLFDMMRDQGAPEADDLGEYIESNLTVQKVEYSDALTTYGLELKSEVGEGYKVSAVIEADPTCLYPNND